MRAGRGSGAAARDGGGTGWGEGTGGVPTKEQLREMFPPIPVNLSVSPVVLVPGIGGSVMSDVSTGLVEFLKTLKKSLAYIRLLQALRVALTFENFGAASMD